MHALTARVTPLHSRSSVLALFTITMPASLLPRPLRPAYPNLCLAFDMNWNVLGHTGGTSGSGGHRRLVDREFFRWLTPLDTHGARSSELSTIPLSGENLSGTSMLGAYLSKRFAKRHVLNR